MLSNIKLADAWHVYKDLQTISPKSCFSHTSAYIRIMLMQAGQPLQLIGDFLGHKSLEMTKRYAHLSQEEGCSVVEILDGLLQNVKNL